MTVQKFLSNSRLYEKSLPKAIFVYDVRLIASIELCLSEGISQSVSRSVSQPVSLLVSQQKILLSKKF